MQTVRHWSRSLPAARQCAHVLQAARRYSRHCACPFPWRAVARQRPAPWAHPPSPQPSPTLSPSTHRHELRYAYCPAMYPNGCPGTATRPEAADVIQTPAPQHGFTLGQLGPYPTSWHSAHQG